MAPVVIVFPMTLATGIGFHDAFINGKNRRTRRFVRQVTDPSWGNILMCNDSRSLSHALPSLGDFFNTIGHKRK
jgi:hypothetical protein